ncbi:hypothetical protein KAJ83_19120, partial [Marivibrio halodurans]
SLYRTLLRIRKGYAGGDAVRYFGAGWRLVVLVGRRRSFVSLDFGLGSDGMVWIGISMSLLLSVYLIRVHQNLCLDLDWMFSDV